MFLDTIWWSMVDGLRGKIICVIQARASSSRFPRKIFAPLRGKPLLYHVVERCREPQCVDDIVIATSTDATDDETENLAYSLGVNVYRGSLLDVRDRFLGAGKGYKFVVRVTADNPFTEGVFLESVAATVQMGDADYVSIQGCPVGTGVQAFSYSLLQKLCERYRDNESKEHVVLESSIRDDEGIRSLWIEAPGHLQAPEVRLTVDTPRDLALVECILIELEKMGLDRTLENCIAVARRLTSARCLSPKQK